ncbi:hypothetical protein [Lentzea sp. NBRC 102530]|uniref:hypothetical protein n=1 Tax=Lentzea sp. NBRC 102530 TaxID=3032201 RepID=UPI0024A1182C|nr:hypothetical protein [Lentzea sp. NBRC 102530]GLY52661.1 hypothetical protein Lesp01_63170 [Lentzea sp. NBRC 102530]
MKRPDARRVTAEWAAHFPELTIVQPRLLLRRFGPIVQGITLEDYGAHYFATAHVHALTTESPTVYLSLGRRATLGQGHGTAVDTAAKPELLARLAAALREQSAPLLDPDAGLVEFLDVYRKFVIKWRGRDPRAYHELRDLVLLPTAAGLADLAAEAFELAVDISQGWSKFDAPMGWDTTADWLDELRARMSDVDALRATVNAEVTEHGLGSVPDSAAVVRQDS